MQAVVVSAFGPYQDAQVADIPCPAIAPHEVLIEVRAAPANFVDLIVIAGKYQFLPKLPFTPGKGPSGIVRKVGAEVSDLKPGDRVLAMAEVGGYAQFVNVAANQCYRFPAALTFSQAAAISLTYDTSWFALHDRARLAAGETVLVLGASGGVGGAAIQLAKAKGARVLAAVSSPDKFARLKQMGADAMVDLSAPDLKESLREQVFALTDGKGVDVIIDPIGGDFFDAAIRALAWRGRLVVIGFAAGRIPQIKVNYLLVKNIEVSGLQVSDYRKRRPEQVAECYRDVFSLFEAGRLTIPEPTELPLSEFREGLRLVDERAAMGRILLIPPLASEEIASS